MKLCKLALSAFASSVFSIPAQETNFPEQCFMTYDEVSAICKTPSTECDELRKVRENEEACPNEDPDPFKAVGDNCHSCTCFCDAKPEEESCVLGTRDSYNADIFMPYGVDAGDSKYQVKKLGVYRVNL